MTSFRPCPIPLVVASKGSSFGIAASSAPTASSRPSRDRALTRVYSGVYASTIDWEALSPWDRYLARVHAVRLRRPDAVFCLESAAALQGLPVFDEPKHVHVLSAWPAAHSTTSGGLALHSFADARAVTDTEYGSAVDVADTVLDLVRLLPPAFALAVADAALREAAADVTIEALIARARAQSWTRGIRQLEWVLPEADARAESVAESVAQAVILWLGYARPELQVEFHYEGVTDRVDFYWRAQRVIGESDGYGKYRTGDIRKSEGRLILEKKREDRLRRHGHPFPRWDFSDSMHVTPLDAKLRAAGLQPIRPQDARMLATLQRNPRSFPWTQR